MSADRADEGPFGLPWKTFFFRRPPPIPEAGADRAKNLDTESGNRISVTE